MNVKKPIVSIVIPLFNGEKYISETIKSVLNQTYSNFELIIIDDKSTDQSLKIAHSYKDQRIKIKSNSIRVGFVNNWNLALNEINGIYGKILPHDDLLEPTCIEKQVDILEKNNEITFVHCGRRIIQPNGKLILRKKPGKEGVINLEKSLREIVLSGTNPIGEPASVLFKSSSMKSIGLFSNDDNFTIDIDYWIRLLTVGPRYSQKDILCSFRIWNKSESFLLYGSQSDSMINFYKKIYLKYPKYIKKIELKIGIIRSKINEIIRGLIYKYITIKSN